MGADQTRWTQSAAQYALATGTPFTLAQSKIASID
jgi:hypothetical protein